MKGLLINDFYSAIGNMKLFLCIIAAVAAVFAVTGNTTFQEIFVYVTIVAFSANAVVSSRKDAISKWNKYEITMPVRRKDIINCKYYSYILWVLAGTALSLTVAYSVSMIHGISGDLTSMMTLGSGIALLIGALFYPISYIVGIEKSETVLIISVIAAIGIVIAILNVLNLYIASFIVRMILFIIFFLVCYTLSYLLTLTMYLKKDIS